MDILSGNTQLAIQDLMFYQVIDKRRRELDDIAKGLAYIFYYFRYNAYHVIQSQLKSAALTMPIFSMRALLNVFALFDVKV